ncbi:MAG TPA: hypothetical protein VHD15_15720 [Hyphomicrobiales bacterium]|nr:hypothetical protein [Hyphomicrobiales bacterium]
MSSSTQFARAAAWAAALLVATASGAAAQAPPSEGHARKPATPDSGNAAGSLSQRLSRSNGVIPPPKNVDPGMSAPVPNPHPHTTPVIPPPGSPGGKSGVEPK